MSNAAVDQKKMDMTQGPMFGKIIRFVLPLMATGFLQLFFNAADLMVLGWFAGDEADTALAAVGCCSSLINLIVNLFIGLSVGVGVVASQYIGAKRYDEVQRTADTAMSVSVIAGVVVGVFGFLMAEPLLSLMGTPQSVLNEAVPYMRAYFVGVPASMVYQYAAAVIRADGDTRHPLIFLSISGVANVLLNVVMVVVFHMGAIGVGIATAASQFLSMIQILIYMRRMKGYCRLSRFRIDAKKLKKIVAIGVPAGLQSMLFSLSNVLIQSTVNTYGETVIAGNTAGNSLDGFAYIAMNAVYHAALTFVGQNVGAGRFDRVKKAAMQCLLLVVAVGVVLSGVLFFFGRELLAIYAPGKPDVVEAGMDRVRIAGGTFFLCGLMEVACGILRGMGKAILPMMVSLAGSCLLRIVWVYTVCPLFPGVIEALYVSYPVSWGLTALVHILCSVYYYRKLSRARPVVQEAV